jgi:hypothetical protein
MARIDREFVGPCFRVIVESNTPGTEPQDPVTS